MLVGDVRCATTGFGSSWKLSGGRKLSSGPTKVSKNRQVRRAVARRVATSCGDMVGVLDTRGGWLTHRATRGDRAHSTTNGPAIAQAPGRMNATSAAAARASTSAPAIRRYTPVTSRADPAFDWAAVTHSSRRRRVTYRRTSVRAMASPISHA